MLSFRGVFKSRKELTCTTEHVIITPAHESGISPGGCVRERYTPYYVRFRRMSAEDIRRYLSEVYVLDKAGAYAMQEKSELIVESVEGDVDNVIGLPVRQLPEVLRRA